MKLVSAVWRWSRTRGRNLVAGCSPLYIHIFSLRRSGLVIEPGKKYTQTVENSFHISKAALELSGSSKLNFYFCVMQPSWSEANLISDADEDTTLMLDFEGQQEYILCHLNKKTNKQESLDLNFQSGDSISIFTQGAAAVHLSG